MLILRFGLMGEDPRTIEEIAEELGISDLRVRQIEHMALNKMFGHMHRSRDILNDFPEK